MRVEVYDLSAKSGRYGRSFKLVPRSSRIGGIKEPLGACDEVGAIVCVSMQIKGQEAFARANLIPGISFIMRYPYRMIGKQDKDSL